MSLQSDWAQTDLERWYRKRYAAVQPALSELKAAARDDRNLMPNLLDCARVHATEGEIVAALQEVFGTYTETPVF